MAVKKLHGEQGSIVAMYHIIGLGASPGVSPEGKKRTGKYENWMDKFIPHPPKTNPASFEKMMNAFNSFLPANESEVPIFKPDKESSFAKTVSPPLIVSTSLADAPVVLILSGLNFLISVAIP